MKFRYGNFDIATEGVTEERVKELVSDGIQGSENKSIIRDMLIDFRYLYDDTKTFETYDQMIEVEPEGRPDVLYVLSDGTQYIWENNVYVAVRKALTKEEIEDIVV